MSDNRHTSSLRRIGKSKKSRPLRRKSNQNNNVHYDTLEPRQLLAGDIGINIDSQAFGAGAGSPINSAGAVGPAHVIEVTDNGLTIFDKGTGAELVSKSLQDFWMDTGGAGAQADAELADSANHHDTRVLYDADERRWFVVSVTGLDISSALGTQNSVLLAVSRSSDPTEDWSTPVDFYDTDGDPATPAIPFRGGFRTNGQTPGTLELSVDDHNIYVTVDEASPFATDTTYIFNKFTDLVVPNADATNRSEIAHGAGSLQWGMDPTASAIGSHGLFIPTSGNQVFVVEAVAPEVAGGVTMATPEIYSVPNFDPPPEFVRQLFDADLVNSDAQLSSHVARRTNKLWAVHAVESSNGSTSAIRWYEFDLTTKVVRQSGTIEHATDNYIFPAISITEEGHVAISYTVTGVDRFPSHGVTLGYVNNGFHVMEDTVILGEGESGYFDGRGNLWGRYQSSFVDAANPEDVWFFGQRTDGAKNGVTRVSQVSLVGMSPRIEADGLDNIIIVRRSAADTTDIEVEIDGTIVGVYEEIYLNSITVDGMGGDDTFTIDTSNGELDFGVLDEMADGNGGLVQHGVIFVGDGDDQVVMQTVETTTWEVGVAGNGIANVGTNIPADCSPQHTDVVTFDLNFEAGSLWFDTTPWTGFADFGEALRTEVTNFYNDVMAPLFTGTFNVSLDINDDETDSFATSAAQGFGFEDVNGVNLWVASPWSILTGNGDRNGAAADAIMAYNLGLDLYGGDRQALLDNIAGITRFQTMNILGMESNIQNATGTTNGIGDSINATVLDYGYLDMNDAQIVGNYDGVGSFEVLSYATNPSWANDNSGIYFTGIDDSGAAVQLPVNSNLELINFDTLASALGGSSRMGPFDQLIEQDRAFLRGMGYSLNPLAFDAPVVGQLVSFSGVDLIQAGAGEDYFCIGSSNVDLEVRGGDGDDYFNITALGIGAVDLHGEMGDDTYQVAFSSAGAITITDGVGTESDTLIGVGTPLDDHFIITNSFIDVNGGVFAQSGVENMSFDGREGDDVFDIRETLTAGNKSILGGDGSDTFFFNDQGSLPQGNSLVVSVENSEVEPVDQLRLDLSGFINDTYLADEVENLQVDGLFEIDGLDGTPTVAGGLNLLGDGDDEVQFVNSIIDATWTIDGDGAGNVLMDVDPMTFVGLDFILGTEGINTFEITQTNTDLEIQTGMGADVFNINNAGTGIVSIMSGAADDIFNINNSGTNGVFLFGEVGDDSYNVNLNNPGGLITIRDSVGSEMDSLSSLGTAGDDHFIFDGGIITVGSVMIDHQGIENVDYNGGDGDDLFEFRSFDSTGDPIFITGGLGNDRFWVNDFGVGANGNILDVKVASPGTALDQLQIDISSVVMGTVFADMIENLDVDGLYRMSDVNGTPTVAGGLNLLGDGNERLEIESMNAAGWSITGDGAGTLVWGGPDPLTFNGLNEILGSRGVDTVNVVNTGTDLQIDTRDAVDVIDFNNVGAGIVTVFAGDADDIFNINNSGGGVFLHGQVGDDLYNIDFNNPGGLITIRDSVNAENDRMTAFGTSGDDHFIFDGSVTGVNGVMVDHLGVENVVYDGLDGDDIFEVRGSSGGDAKVITGGLGNDTFIVNDMGAGANGNVLTVSVANPSGAVNQVQLDVSSVITDTFLADTIENLSVDGLYLFDGVNGTATVAGGFNLLGDGNERLEVETNIAANWTITGDGAGTVTMDVEPMTFNGLGLIDGSHGVDTVAVLATGTDIEIRTRESDDVIDVNTVGAGAVTVRAGDGNDLMNAIRSGVNGVNLYGEAGDDTYTIDMNGPHGLITVRDSVNAESDTLNVLGTAGDDLFVFDGGVVNVNGINVDIIGIENGGFDGLAGDDTFEVISGSGGDGIGIRGGAGNDTFIVNDGGLGGNANTLTVSVANPSIFADQVRLDVASVITETFYADAIENLSVDGTYIFDGVNGTPTVAGGFNLLGDGNERLVIESNVAADWLINGNGAGTVTMDVAPMTFNGLEAIDGSHGVDTFNVTGTGTDLTIRSREADDSITIANLAAGVVTVSSGLGDDTFLVTSSGGGVNLSGDAGSDTFTYDDGGTGAGVLNGGAGDDTFDILNSGVATLDVNGDDGVDTFNINNPLGTADTVVRGGNGDDFFTVTDSGMGDLALFGEVGDDTYTVQYVDPAITFMIRDSVNAENDTLLAVGTDGDDVFDIGPDGATFNGGFPWDVIGVESFGYDGLAGNDTFNVDMGDAWDGDLTLRGGDDDDIFNIINAGTGVIRLFGDAGDDTYNVWFRTGTDVRIVDSVGSENDRFFGFGTAGVDVFNLGIGTANVNGGVVTMTGVESVDYDGFESDDIFNISDTQVTSTFRGGLGDDTFNVTQSNGVADFFGGAGDDTFDVGNAVGVNRFLGEGGADHFTVTNLAPRNSSGSMLIDGGSSRNRLIVNGYPTTNVVTVTNSRISGMSAVPIDYVAAGSFTVADGLGGITLNASSQNDAFDVNSFLAKHSLHMNGFDGNDRFTVQTAALGGISADGGEGSDLYQYEVGSANNRFLFALDTGTVGSDRLVANLTDLANNVRFSGTAFQVDTDRVQFNENLEALVINARGGDDTIDIDRIPVGFVRVIGGAGDDTVNVNNFTGISSMLVNLGDGNDFLNIQAGSVTGTITAFGGDGDDRFVTSRAAYSTAILDGQEGSDSYEVFILDRSKRLVVARDTGTTGIDELTVHGTALDDRLDLRSGIVITPHQDILSNDNTEITNLFTEGLDDVVNVYGLSSPTTNLMVEEGEDLVFVNSTFGPADVKTLNIDSGSGHDTTIVRGTQADTTTTLIGGLGDDNVTLGSTLADNNGNLDTIYGTVHVEGGVGNDRLYLNDVGRTASYNYDVGPTYVRNGGSASNFFAGVTFDSSIETFRMDATEFRNHVRVTPSADTAFALYGEGGFNTIELEGDASDGRKFFGENGGNGFWTFTDGTKDVFFSDFFLG